jgi:hypothetical protein
MNPKNIQTTATVLRTARRYGYLVGYIALSFLFIILGILAQLFLDDTFTVVFLIGSGIVGFVFAIWNFVRQGKKYTASDNAMKEKTTYQDMSGDAVRFNAPEVSSEQVDLAGQEPIASVYPLMATGLVGLSFMGQTRVQNQENTMIVTKDYVIGVQIPITEGSSQGVASAATLIGAAVGADAAYQNSMVTMFAGGQLSAAVKEVLTKNTLVDISKKYYSYALPLASIDSVAVHAAAGNMFSIKIISDAYAREFLCKDAALVKSFVAGLKSVHVQVNQN